MTIFCKVKPDDSTLWFRFSDVAFFGKSGDDAPPEAMIRITGDTGHTVKLPCSVDLFLNAIAVASRQEADYEVINLHIEQDLCWYKQSDGTLVEITDES